MSPQQSDSVLVHNGRGANLLSARILLASACFVAFVFLLEVVGIFNDGIAAVALPFGLTVALLIAAGLLIRRYRQNTTWVKYLAVSTSAVALAILNMFLPKDIVVLYIFPVAVASLYFSTALSWYGTILTMVLMTASLAVGEALGISDLKSFADGLATLALARNIEVLLLSLVFTVLSRRMEGMLRNLVGAEEQKRTADELAGMLQRSVETATALHGTVESLNGISTRTRTASEGIVSGIGNAEKNQGRLRPTSRRRWNGWAASRTACRESPSRAGGWNWSRRTSREWRRTAAGRSAWRWSRCAASRPRRRRACSWSRAWSRARRRSAGSWR